MVTQPHGEAERAATGECRGVVHAAVHRDHVATAGQRASQRPPNGHRELVAVQHVEIVLDDDNQEVVFSRQEWRYYFGILFGY